MGLLALGEAAGGTVVIDWVTIDDPGNPPDDVAVHCCIEEWNGTTGYGSVDYVYRIGRTEVSSAQYTEFLNAVADADPHGLYTANMSQIGITRSGVSGSYSYAVSDACAQRPVAVLDFFDALRFINWLHNGQLEDPATTEDGAYALLGSNPLDVQREPDAQIFLPSEDEWYKAAYYDPELQGYHFYPTGTDVPPAPGAPPGEPNTANYCHAPQVCKNVPTAGCPSGVLASPSVSHTVDVGSYVSSPSPFGTLDQGGNLSEWSESRVIDRPPPELPIGVTRGGWFRVGLPELSSEIVVSPPLECQSCEGIGLRVAAVPEPGSGFPLLGVAAAIALARVRRDRR